MHTAYLKNYKKEFKNYINNHKDLTHVSFLTINPSELYCNSTRITWEDENKEVVYQDVLYDIVSIKNNGLTVELTVVSDEQEMEIKKQFGSLYNVDSHSSTKAPLHLLKGFFALKCIVNTTGIEFKSLEITNGSYHPPQPFKLRNRVISKDSPPPDFFL